MHKSSSTSIEHEKKATSSSTMGCIFLPNTRTCKVHLHHWLHYFRHASPREQTTRLHVGALLKQLLHASMLLREDSGRAGSCRREWELQHASR
jgi:hypothetical protein